MNQNPRGMPSVGDEILIKASTLRAWFLATVSSIQDNHIVTGSGMGTRVFDVKQYGKTWKWSKRASTG
jgi:hypothetical protein